MIPEDKFNEKQAELYQLMSDISEDCYYAGWLDGNEYSIWRAIETGNIGYGIKDMDVYALSRCADLAKELDGWIIWMDERDDPSMPVDEWGPRFISMSNWLERVNEMDSAA